ncbi:class I SAM-dependent methyltransferase [Allosphingosinicella vermicomposti]|uniref:class I SAM-dependent methyltransferase n=1 Tax=Allosphingosinicella vermicomposti TaxID=614671 RepID=UPI000D0E3EDE|nr:class I SAM-dependent methyltransferase [Allosphingosinicella vermicomposti]
MRQSIVRSLALLSFLAAGTAGAAIVQHEEHGAHASDGLAKAIAAPSRTPANLARDQYRHPAETLAFFGVKPSNTVVEIWPGDGWYTEILAPYVASGGGTLYTVASGRGLGGVNRLKEANPAVYGAIKTADFPAMGAEASRVPDGTADAVLTFRNVHNWQMGNSPFAPEAFKQMFAMLKSGGTLGIVEHRLPESADDALEKSSGYTKVSTVRRLAEEAGFKFVGASEVNANAKDTANHPNGVWSLPPTFRGGDADREKYTAIGESDRMTLKFVKP